MILHFECIYIRIEEIDCIARTDKANSRMGDMYEISGHEQRRSWRIL